MQLSREELRELFIYDETVPSCLRWRKSGRVAGHLDDAWRIQIKTEVHPRRKYQIADIIYQLHHGDLTKGDVVRIINNFPTPKIDNIEIYRKEDISKFKYNKLNRNWESIFTYKDGELYWKVINFTGKYPSIRLCNTVGEILHKYTNNEGYNMVTIQHKGSTQYSHHRMIWEVHYGEIPENMYVDHINGIRTDNRIENLRLVTREGNARNNGLQKNNTSGVKGVHYCCDNTYVAHVSYMGKKRCRKFSIKKYGEELAFLLAVECRKKMIDELNELYDNEKYTERHKENSV